MFNMCQKLKEIKGINNFNTSQVTNMESVFKDCEELEYLDLSNFNTIKVIDMESMFKKCINLKEIKGINNFKIFKNTKKDEIFSGCINLRNLELSYFDDSQNYNDNTERLLEIIFLSINQQIKYTVYCLKTDSFSKIEKELYDKFPELKFKQDIYFLACGNKINTSATLEENRIKEDTNILIYQKI